MSPGGEGAGEPVGEPAGARRQASPAQVYGGGCLCGTVRFTFVGTPRFVAHCVCESCRRAHGATVVGWVGVNTAAFSLQAGEGVFRWYRSSEASERGFCTHCGTRLLFRSDKWPGEMHMALACVDLPHDLRANVISFREEWPDWAGFAPD